MDQDHGNTIPSAAYVWEVTAVGGDPTAVHTAICCGIDLLRGGTPVDSLTDREVDVWHRDVLAVAADDVAHQDGHTSVLVKVALYSAQDHPSLAAMLSGGFDEVVLPLVMDVPGVTQASHTDRIATI